MDLSKLSLGDKIVGGTGIVLLITLLFLPWHHVQVCFTILGDETCGDSVNRTAVQSPNAFWGWLAVLLTLAILGVLIADRVAGAELPELPIAWNQALFYGCIATLVLLLLKLVMETSALGFGCYLALLLAAGMTYGGFLIFKDEGAGASAGGTGGGGAPPQPF
jgi:hypothetical protein